MAITAYFTPKSMNDAQYREVLRRLEQAGVGKPTGRRYHVCLGEGDRLEVLDVWDSAESFDQFGQKLIPILGEVGVDPGEPRIQPLVNTLVG